MGLLNPHLDDTAFAEVFAARMALGAAESDRPEERHLHACGDCRTRYSTFASWLATMAVDAHAEADEVFAADRLANQQQQVLRRLEALEHPARVIAFPRGSTPAISVPSGRRRWIAAAAAAGLVVGVGLGQVLEFGRTSNGRLPGTVTEDRPIAGSTLPPVEGGRRGVQPVASTVSDESFLYDQEPGSSSYARVPESLQYLNAVTPMSRDFDPR